MERRIAEEVLLQHRPISGLEVAYLRQVYGISRRAFAKEIGLSDVAVLKWERAKRKRLVTTSEIAVRVFFAKKLGLSLSHVTTPLIPTGKLTAKLMVEFDRKSSPAPVC
jgi:transcriptional regulator with XRE-family HTH domain